MTARPQRVQRKRTKGWRMPSDAIYVGRPTKWGNPFQPYTTVDGLFASEMGIRISDGPRTLRDGLIAVNVMGVEHALTLYRLWALQRSLQEPGYFSPLRGNPLCCWCPLDRPCHADVLLDLANGS